PAEQLMLLERLCFQVTETPPKCIIPLTNVTAALGTPVILQCLVNGKPNPTAEWYKDGERVTDSRCIIQEKTAGHFNLLITNVTQSDAGEYKCEFKCSKDHDTYTLLIHKVVKERHQGEYVCEAENEAGRTTTSSGLTCSLTGSSPMEVVWHKDNIAVSSEGNYVTKCEKNKYSLHIRNLDLTNQGVYLCKVIDKPRFVRTVEPASAAVNDPVRLEPAVLFKAGGECYRGGGEHSQTAGHLEGLGSHHCEVDEGLGSTER
uniref:Ig-like domain-containing protein n=1 Tax=Salarias fasciatus TaxID=181472 RepID=A0A672I9W9_SALFA